MPASTEVYVPKAVKDLGAQPAGQRYNLENVRSAYELRAALDRICLPTAEFREMPAFVADALRPWSVKLDNYMSRLVTPLVLAVKLEAVETISAARSSLMRSSSTGKAGADPTMTAVTSAHLALPSYLRELRAQLEAAGQLFKSLGCHKDLDKWIVNIGSHLVWKGMLYYACRPCPPPVNRPSPIPAHVSRPQNTSSRGKALPLLRPKQRGGSPPPLATPEDPHTHLVSEVAAFRAIISAFATPVLTSPAPPDEDGLRNAKNVKELCDAFNLLPEIPSDDESDDEPELAHEAMHEALLALGSFELTIRALRWPDELTAAFIYDDDDSSSSDEEDPARTPSAVFQLTGPGSPATRVAAEKARQSKMPDRLVPVKLPDPTLDRALDTLPPLITFHLLASRLEGFRLPHEIWQLSGGWQQYDAQLQGFSVGDHFKEEVGWEMVAELDRMRALRPLAPEDTWPALLRCAVKCEGQLLLYLTFFSCFQFGPMLNVHYLLCSRNLDLHAITCCLQKNVSLGFSLHPLLENNQSQYLHPMAGFSAGNGVSFQYSNTLLPFFCPFWVHLEKHISKGRVFFPSLMPKISMHFTLSKQKSYSGRAQSEKRAKVGSPMEEGACLQGAKASGVCILVCMCVATEPLACDGWQSLWSRPSLDLEGFSSV